jgi:ribosomal-protein-alanine N-acetyltransferase
VARVARLDVASIHTERLELLAFTPEVIEALLAHGGELAAELLGASIPADWPDRHDERFLRLRLGQLRAHGDLQEWSVRGVVLADEGALVGHIGFHGPPGVNALRRPDGVEVGYSIFPPYRRRGIATEALRSLIGWTRDERGIRAFVASVSPQNEASLGVVANLGFEHVGEHWDEEDGLEHEFLLELP